MHMVLTPAQWGGVVLHCKAAVLRIVSRDEWERHGAGATPLAVLSQEEGRVLERFLRYWLGDEDTGPLLHERGVSAGSDY
jgi:hypothetical protein